MPCAGASEETGTAGQPLTPLQEPLESWGWGRGAGQRCPHLPPWPWLVAAGGKNGRLGRMARWEGDGQSGKSEPRGQCPLTPRKSAPLGVGKGVGFGRWRSTAEGAGRRGSGLGAPGSSPPSCGSERLAAWQREPCPAVRGLPSTWTQKGTCQQTSQRERRRLGSEQSQAGPGSSGLRAPLKNQCPPKL